MGIINERITELREHKGYSEEYIAEKLKISINSYRKYENNKILDLNELIAISDVFDISTDYLLGNTDIPIPVLTDKNAELIMALSRMSEVDLQTVQKKSSEL